MKKTERPLRGPTAKTKPEKWGSRRMVSMGQPEDSDPNGDWVILPEDGRGMSIVKAVRLLTEARKQGVELWMQKTPPFCEPSWSKLSSTGIEMFACTYHHGEDWKDWSMSTGHILSKWIVATPEDARRIDARGKK